MSAKKKKCLNLRKIAHFFWILKITGLHGSNLWPQEKNSIWWKYA